MKQLLFAFLLATLAGQVAAQAPAAATFQLQCEANPNTQLRKTYCETRDLTLPAPPTGTALSIDARLNGSISVRSWSGAVVRVRALVQASSGELAAAWALAANVRISTTGHQVQAARPNGSLDDWAVSYEVLVPTRTNIALHATNGSLHLENVQGTITFETTNGSVRLLNLAGDVRGKTTNGSIALTLSGSTWDGTGFDVKTTSGSIRCQLPATYAATLTARTTNGRVTAKLAPATRKQLLPRSLIATFGKGGPQLRLATVHGSIDVQQTGMMPASPASEPEAR
ncbi:DUF4097 family beta strand repeat-containing protein [Hymenobacter puniceus]|uniref:DUF4097 family beta strand repeat-containing protein n=1 Tax=Hymenobacter sp. BT190 TaxID=2763505 RepID=UPI00165134A8|nr:DUF4097 family beta strand repeat-containing protein [Hymenobacter sp. BT190]MBC6699209.1 DUF4097 family beta strand repeat protein [Hymenobacter sp. BT190]